MWIARARTKVSRHACAQLAKLPESQVTDTTLGATVVLDVDATLVTAHSEKQFAAGTLKGGLPTICCRLGAITPRICAVVMRPDNAGSNTVADQQRAHRCHCPGSGHLSQAHAGPRRRRWKVNGA